MSPMKSKIIFSKIIPILLFCVISLASCGRGANTVPSVRFDRTTAFENMTEIAEIGQRHSGSEGALSTVELIEKKLTEYGVPHFRDEWYEDTAYGKILFRNVVAQIKVPGKNNLILLGTHYDTKKLENCQDSKAPMTERRELRFCLSVQGFSWNRGRN